MELTDTGDLYTSVMLPSLIVGTVGGGTHLPTQKECLERLDCYGAGKAKKFAEICGALALAGELSIAAALSAGHFARAHKIYGRKKSKG
jgi:hydroxymethylglutaryl-CoA reductase (NADPH)